MRAKITKDMRSQLDLMISSSEWPMEPTFLVSTFAPEARGHGVPEVMDAIYYKGGVIRPVVAVVKSLASAIAIGSGAAVGREGPIIQIGSALGSTLGQSPRGRAVI
jgi:CIC family chloride channel protein